MKVRFVYLFAVLLLLSGCGGSGGGGGGGGSVVTMTDSEAVSEDIAALTFDTIRQENTSEASIVSDLNLPGEGERYDDQLGIFRYQRCRDKRECHPTELPERRYKHYSLRYRSQRQCQQQ